MDNILGKVTEETLDLVKAQLSVEKAITTGTGLMGYSLEAPAQQLVPFLSPLRNRIHRNLAKTGTSVHWKAITDISAAGKLTTTEGSRGNTVSYSVEDRLASFQTFGLQDSVTLEAIAGGRGFDDVKARASTNLLMKLMTEEEKLILGGNHTSLGVVAAPAGVAAAGGSLAASDYFVKVVALTVAAANRVVLNTTIADLSLPVFDGVTLPSAETTVAGVTANQKVTFSVTPVKGAVAYAWFVSKTTGTETLQCVTTTSSYEMKEFVTGGTAASAVTADTSGDATSFDGIIPQIISGKGYFKDFANGKFTKAYGGIKEIDDMLSYFFQRLKCTPTRFIVSEQVSKDITNAVIAGQGAPLLQVSMSEKASVVANYVVTEYINKSFGGYRIPIEVHPWLPNGSMVAITEQLPYPNANVPNVLEMEMGYDYQQLEYAFSNPKYEFEVRAFGALKYYFPVGGAFLTNLSAGISE